MKDFLTFRKMITPIVIQVLFWLGLLAVVVMAIVSMATGQVLGGLLTLILGPIMVRVYCELIILAFRIYDRMADIARNTAGPAASPAASVQP